MSHKITINLCDQGYREIPGITKSVDDELLRTAGMPRIKKGPCDYRRNGIDIRGGLVPNFGTHVCTDRATSR